MVRILVLLSVCFLLVVSGLAQGVWTGRWVASHTLEEATERLYDVPLQVGDWRGTVQDIPPKEIAGARVNGHFSCHYWNPRKKQTITILLLCGRPGPVSVHTPDICYRSLGYTAITGPDPLKVPLADEEATVQAATFRKQNVAVPSELRIFWAWNTDGRWQAPSNPRWTFAGSPALYKLYVIRERGAKESGPIEQDPAVDFMQELLPVINRTLFRAVPSGG